MGLQQGLMDANGVRPTKRGLASANETPLVRLFHGENNQ